MPHLTKSAVYNALGKVWREHRACFAAVFVTPKHSLLTRWALNRCFAWLSGTMAVRAQGGGGGGYTRTYPPAYSLSLDGTAPISPPPLENAASSAAAAPLPCSQWLTLPPAPPTFPQVSRDGGAAADREALAGQRHPDHQLRSAAVLLQRGQAGGQPVFRGEGGDAADEAQQTAVPQHDPQSVRARSPVPRLPSGSCTRGAPHKRQSTGCGTQ